MLAQVTNALDTPPSSHVRVLNPEAPCCHYCPHNPQTPLALPMLSGLFHFNASFRPVPLEMQFIGVSVGNFMARNTMMAEICYGKVRC